MTAHDDGAILDRAERAATAGAAAAMEAFRTEMTIGTKDDEMDVVTAADVEAQRRVIDSLQATAGDGPADAVVAEEEDAPKDVPEAGDAWVVDPIDGTANFARGNRLWAVSVAFVTDGAASISATALPAMGDTYLGGPDGVVRNGTPAAPSDATDPGRSVASPMFGSRQRRGDVAGRLTRALFEAFGDVRRLGSSHATLAMIADGQLDVAVAPGRLEPWDTMGGVNLVRRSGGTVTDLDGAPWRHDSDGLVASNGAAHDRVLRALCAADGPLEP